MLRSGPVRVPVLQETEIFPSNPFVSFISLQEKLSSLLTLLSFFISFFFNWLFVSEIKKINVCVSSEVQKLSSLVLPSEVIIAQSSVPGKKLSLVCLNIRLD